MPDYRIKMPTLHRAQKKILAESKRYNTIVCGRRFGKTFLACDILIDGPRGKGALHGYPCALFAPTHQTMLESWRKFVEILRPITDRKSEQEKRIDLLTGGSITCYSLDDPDTGRGRRFGTVCIDEAAMIKRLEEAWTQTIQPALLDFQGEAYFMSTPKGANYFKTLFDKGDPANDNKDGDWMSWQMPTVSNPFISPEDVAAMEADMPRLAALQELHAQFVSFAGTFVKAEHIRVGQPPLMGLRLYQGVDLAISMKENSDFTAIVTVGVDEGGRVWIVDAERRRVGFRDALDFIKEKAARWRPDAIAIEAVQYQAAVVEELLRSTDLPVFQVRPDKDKLTRAQGLITRYENGLVWHSESLPRYFVEEILSFGPDCEHDDLVDAAVYAYMQTGDYGRARFLYVDETQKTQIRERLESQMPGLPLVVLDAVESISNAGRCGGCSAYSPEYGVCTERGFTVKEDDMGCDFYLPLS